MYTLIIVHFLMGGASQVTTVGTVEHSHLHECTVAAAQHTDATHSAACIDPSKAQAQLASCTHTGAVHVDSWGVISESDDLAGYSLESWECR